jgi:hypothetical protein
MDPLELLRFGGVVADDRERGAAAVLLRVFYYSRRSELPYQTMAQLPRGPLATPAADGRRITSIGEFSYMWATVLQGPGHLWCYPLRWLVLL